MGWLPDYPSFKDYTPQTKNIAPLFKKVDLDDALKVKILKTSLLSKQDLRKWCSPLEDQGQLRSCTANAGLGLWNILKDERMENILMPHDYSFTK